MNSTQISTHFKKCTLCGFEWVRRDDFIGDPDNEIIGYQVDFVELSAGLFLFNHSCKGTLAIQAGAFEDLYTGPVFKNRVTGSEECPEYCLHEDELLPCPKQCECAYVREIIQIIKCWPKK